MRVQEAKAAKSNNKNYNKTHNKNIKRINLFGGVVSAAFTLRLVVWVEPPVEQAVGQMAERRARVGALEVVGAHQNKHLSVQPHPQRLGTGERLFCNDFVRAGGRGYLKEMWRKYVY
jgi:hypothetical protein